MTCCYRGNDCDNLHDRHGEKDIVDDKMCPSKEVDAIKTTACQEIGGSPACFGEAGD